MDGRVTGVVIDVRDNPGGIKDEGVKRATCSCHPERF